MEEKVNGKMRDIDKKRRLKNTNETKKERKWVRRKRIKAIEKQTNNNNNKKKLNKK